MPDPRSDRPARRRRMRHGITPAAALLLVLAGTACEPPKTLTVSTVLGGLDHPWDLAFTPDARLLFTERSGAVERGRQRGASRAGPTRRCVRHQRGRDDGPRRRPRLRREPPDLHLLRVDGLAVHADVRIVRWTVDAGFTALTGRTDILTGGPVSSGRHTGCRLRFGPDGNLWVTTGDAAINTTPQDPTLARRQGAAHHDERGGCRRQPGRRAATRDLHLRPPQRAGRRVPPRRPGLRDRARHRPGRRGQPAAARRQLRLGPGARRWRHGLRRVPADDRPGPVPDARCRPCGARATRPSPRPAARSSTVRSGAAGTARSPWPCSRTASCGSSPSPRTTPTVTQHVRLTDQGRSAGRRAGTRRQPLPDDRRQPGVDPQGRAHALSPGMTTIWLR